MDELDIKPILESILFVSNGPVRLETLVEILPEFSREAILQGIQRIQSEGEEGSKGIELVEVAGGYQFRTKSQWAEWITRLKKIKAVKLSQSAMETLAIITYRQPVIRPEIEQIRGVDSGWVIRSLMEKGLVKMMGRKDLPGRPIIYGTTKAFLDIFGLRALSDLPTLKDVVPPQREGAEEGPPEGDAPEPSPAQPRSVRDGSGVQEEIEEVLEEIEPEKDEDAQ